LVSKVRKCNKIESLNLISQRIEYGLRSVYDKAKYHLESVENDGLDEVQAYVHTAFYLRWILEHKLFSQEFFEESKEEIEKFQNRELTALQIYQNWDGCLIDDMLSDEGNAFSQFYFDFEKGQYIHDYGILADDLWSIFSLRFNDENYSKIEPLIDRAYQSWKNSRP
jgi:hypothetical protein